MIDLIFWVLFGVIILGAIAGGVRARRAVDLAIGHDPRALAEAWQHRQLVENKVIAIRANHRRMS